MNRRSFFATLLALPLLSRLRLDTKPTPIRERTCTVLPLRMAPTTIRLADGSRVTLGDWVHEPMYPIPQDLGFHVGKSRTVKFKSS